MIAIKKMAHCPGANDFFKRWYTLRCGRAVPRPGKGGPYPESPGFGRECAARCCSAGLGQKKRL